jgi:hypothetical protein
MRAAPRPKSHSCSRRAPVKAIVTGAVAGVVTGAVAGAVAGAVTGAGGVVDTVTAGEVTGVTVLVTVDEQPEDVVQFPSVIVAVLVMVPVAVDATRAAKVAVAVSPGASVTVKVHVLPDGLATMQLSVAGVVTTHPGVPWTVSEDGTSSVTVADPVAVPTFVMATV